MNTLTINTNRQMGSALKRAAQWTTILCMVLLGYSQSYAQCGGVSMACNDGLQVSLDENCQALIAPDMVLENIQFPPNEYLVELFDENGNLVVGTPIIDGSYIGQTITFSVTLLPCNLTCWGNLTVEDKFAPQADCGSDVTVTCTDSTDPAFTGFPSVIENCGIGNMEYSDDEEMQSCTEPFASIITRTWLITDNSGNTASCVQTINVMRGDLADVTFPADVEYTCDNPPPFTTDGKPDPDVTGWPTSISCPNIQNYYTDVNFDLCGASYKVLRTWVVIDWCTGQQRTENQIIKVLDKAAPVISCPADSPIPGSPNSFGVVVSTDNDACSATWNVVPPIIINECSGWSFEIAYLLADEFGHPVNGTYITDEVSGTSPNYVISNLPQGLTWLKYTVTDDCGYQTSCFTEIFVQDDVAPAPVCEGYSVVSLFNDECVEVYAVSFDDHSWDNCGVVDFLVSRDGEPYEETVEFCCDDAANSPISVSLRVFDEAGNFNDCIVNVHVDDQVAPEITYCPPSMTVDCNVDYTDPNNTGGYATATDNCGVTVTHSDGGGMDVCNMGQVIRTWTATDVSGKVTTCTQTITVVNNNPLMDNQIVWPTAELTVDACNNSADIDPDVLNSKPYTTNNSPCVSIGISYTDQPFYNIPGVCVQVVRTWKVTDWCDNSVPTKYFGFVQKINLSGGEDPTFPECEDITIDSGVSNCQGYVEIIKTASDDCTPSTQLVYSYEIDLFNNGTIDVTGVNNNASDIYPAGTHKISFTATDECGNEGMCMFLFSVQDDKDPIPICLAEIVLPLDNNGQAEIWASDFNLKSEDACSPEDQLTYSFNAAGTQPSMSFTCADIPNGVAVEILLQMHVFDTGGNSEFCSVVLILQDNSGQCPDVNNATARVAGIVKSEMQEEVQDVEVGLMETSSSNMQMEMTNNIGIYEFDDVAFYNAYEINPVKTTDVMNGVSTLDLVLIQKHILNLQKITSPYSLIAADVNNNNTVSATDLIELRKMILGIFTEFPNNDAYRFVPESYEFVDAAYPWGFDESIILDELYISEDEANFIAIKTGDVNASAVYNATNNEASNRSGETLSLTADNTSFTTGSSFEWNLEANDFEDMVGFQYTISFDPSALKFDGISKGAVEMSQANYNLTSIDEGLITVSWNDINATTVEDKTTLMGIIFTALTDGHASEYLAVNSEITKAEAYNSAYEIMDLDLNFRSVDNEFSDVQLFQNKPNPFSLFTTIGYHLPNAGDVEIKVFDLNGAEILSQKATAKKGYNESMIYGEQLPSSGVYYVQLHANNLVKTQKIIVIN